MNRFTKNISYLLVLVFLLPSKTFGYGYLYEFLAPDFSEVRNPSTGPETDDDVLAAPRWYDASVSMRLCVGGTGITKGGIGINAVVIFDATPTNTAAERNAQLLTDTNAALAEWDSAASSTTLDISAAGSADTTCGPNLGDTFGGNSGSSAGSNDIFFNNKYDDGSSISSGTVAYTILNFTLNGDNNLEMVDADIVFNTANKFVTTAWYAENTNPALTDRFSYQGVLTHELGHLYGLAHSFVTDDNNSDGVTTTASMYPSVSSLGQTVSFEDLMDDDILGFKNLYGNSGTFSGSSFGGSISGVVTRSNNRGQRGAQVTVFDVDNERTFASVYSGMGGTAAEPNGRWQIKALPLNRDFIVFVEDADRASEDSASFPNWLPDIVNTPMRWGLDEDNTAGLRNFVFEAYPDAEIVDVRDERDVTVAPTISAAEVIRLTSSSASRSGIDFYISENILPPNDDFSMTLLPTTSRDSGTGSLNVNNNAPLQLEVNMAADLGILDGILISVLARNTSTGETVNLVNGLPSLENWEKTRALLTLAPPSGGLENGTYTLTTSLSANFSGTDVDLVDASRTIVVTGWTSGSSSIHFGDGTGGTGGGGGGCSFDRTDSSPGTWVLLMLFFTFLFVDRRRKTLR